METRGRRGRGREVRRVYGCYRYGIQSMQGLRGAGARGPACGSRSCEGRVGWRRGASGRQTGTRLATHIPAPVLKHPTATPTTATHTIATRTTTTRTTTAATTAACITTCAHRHHRQAGGLRPPQGGGGGSSSWGVCVGPFMWRTETGGMKGGHGGLWARAGGQRQCCGAGAYMGKAGEMDSIATPRAPRHTGATSSAHAVPYPRSHAAHAHVPLSRIVTANLTHNHTTTQPGD